MDTSAVADALLHAEIEALRTQYPDTQDLYREVCLVLFFRRGITPTANKLYQLVRKGSMSAPAEALNRFWETLREKSRIRIEHPDLPATLQDAAGEMIGALWQRAQAAAQEALESLREDARARVIEAQSVAAAATARLQDAELNLQAVQQELQAMVDKVAGIQSNLTRMQGESTALRDQINEGAAQRHELQECLQTAQQSFTTELEKQRMTSTTIEGRHAADVRQRLLDVDRERVHVAKLQKDLVTYQRMQADQAKLHHQQVTEKQVQAEELRQRNGELEGSLTELREQRSQLLQDVAVMRLRLESKPALRKARSVKALKVVK